MKPTDIAPNVRVMQVIVLALLAGLGIFGGIAFALGQTGNTPDNVLTVVGLGAAAVVVVARLSVPYLAAGSLVGKIARGEPLDSRATSNDSNTKPMSEPLQLCGVYQTTTIIAAALLEGGGFFNLIAYVVEGNILNLVAAGVLSIGILLLLPTVGGVEQWIAAQQRRVEDLRATYLMKKDERT